MIIKMQKTNSKPDWLKIQLPQGENYLSVKKIVHHYKLNTICQSGKCPNIGECWGAGTATFMILGNSCTRACKFCAVGSKSILPPDPDEPDYVAESVKLMGLKSVVITSVTRDDLEDGGANHWAKTIKRVRDISPETKIEALIPDLMGVNELLCIIINEKPDIISHNMETVESLSHIVRSKATYQTSLRVLSFLSEMHPVVKTGIMVGVGETDDEVFKTMDEVYATGCKIFTIGQYLQPTKDNLPVHRYVHPDIFKSYENYGLKLGFLAVESGPLVRSSYHAEKHVLQKKV